MALTTAALTISSSDLVGDALSLTTSTTLNKADTTTGLDQTAGMNVAYLTATTRIDIFPQLIEASIAFENKSSWVYICNKSTDATEYITVTICENVIGRLYAGDFLWMPWSMRESANANNHHGDIQITPSVATGMWLDWICINEGTEYPEGNLATA